jgi:serine O-acetyltransferase
MIKEDMIRYNIRYTLLLKIWLSGHTFFAVLNYRIAHYLYKHKVKLLPDIIKFRTTKRYCCEISPYCTIGPGLFLPHSIGIVIGHEVIIGRNCEFFQNVTIGSNRKKKNGRYMPIIGDNVSIGSGAVIVGPIKIGDHVIIGANSYVDKDVPSDVVIAGSPAKIIRYL